MNADAQGDPQRPLFSEAELALTYDLPLEPLTDMGSNPVWTDNKARFIMLYLRYFVYITHHGTYIDGFAGPQADVKPIRGQRNSCWRANPDGIGTFIFATRTDHRLYA